MRRRTVWLALRCAGSMGAPTPAAPVARALPTNSRRGPQRGALILGLAWALLGPPLPAQAGPPATPATSAGKAALAEPASASAPAPRAAPLDAPRLVRVELPRDSGHFLGDVVRYRALLVWPRDWVLDRDGLPTPARADAPIELHGHHVEPAEQACAGCRWLVLDWQLFKGVRLVEDVALAPATVRWRRDAELATVELPGARLAQAPLVPWDGRRDWLDSVRPGWRPVPYTPQDRWREAGLAGGVALLALIAWAWASGRWIAPAAKRPFAAAWRALQPRRRRARGAHPTVVDADDWRHFHAAFDAAAGQAVFAEHLPAFFADRPQGPLLAAASAAMFAASRRAFFLTPSASGDADGVTIEALRDLLRALADAEFEAHRAATRRLRHA